MTGLFLPKAWVFADEQSRVVTKNIAAQMRGEGKSSRFDGRGFCYIEVGDGLAAYGSGNFYNYPAPKVYLEPPSHRHHEERKRLNWNSWKPLCDQRGIFAGASGYLIKESASDELIAAIRKVSIGGKYISSSLTETALSRRFQTSSATEFSQRRARGQSTESNPSCFTGSYK